MIVPLLHRLNRRLLTHRLAHPINCSWLFEQRLVGNGPQHLWIVVELEERLRIVFHILSAAAQSVSRITFTSSARALSTFPGQHHPVPYGQADILNARVGLDETVKGDDGVIISILGLYHFAAPQNIVADDQPAGFE